MTKLPLFHEGELELQRLTGEQDIAEKVGRLVQNSIAPQQLDFIRKQSVLWVGIEDQENLLWAFPLFGSPGFINPGEGKLIEIELAKKNYPAEEWLDYLEEGKSIGCLVIDPMSRRRLRINGVIKKPGKHRLQVAVMQSYPNCPKYIRRREVRDRPGQSGFYFISSGMTVNSQVKSILEQSDTAYVASIGPNGADLSHRGGSTGFIKCESQNTIIVPDYKGNSLFNTLGNFSLNPNGGIMIVDYERNYFLQITGKVNVFTNEKFTKLNTGGTDRFWVMTIHKWQLFQQHKHVVWKSQDFSPYNPQEA